MKKEKQKVEEKKINITYYKVDDLIEYEKNNKVHPQEQIDILADSIREMGFRNPVLIDKNNVIVAGHGRLMAAKQIGMTDVPCILIDDLTEAQIRKYRLLDNRTAEFSQDNVENIKIELDELGDEALKNLYPDILEVDMGETEEKKTKWEIEFTEELMESHNYVVLYFDNEIDWMTAMEKLEIKTKKTPDSRPWYERAGIGRVVRGADVISRII